MGVLVMQGGAAIKSGTRVPEDFDRLGLPRPLEIVRTPKRDENLAWPSLEASYHVIC